VGKGKQKTRARIRRNKSNEKAERELRVYLRIKLSSLGGVCTGTYGTYEWVIKRKPGSQLKKKKKKKKKRKGIISQDR
jgi:hypothetical protein